jgi:hypothetical protein
MPSVDDHLQQALHNERFFEFTQTASPICTDWQVVALFYAALHYVDAALAERGIHPESHGERLSEVRVRHGRIFFEYRQLRDASEEARYKLAPYAPADVQRLLDGEFVRIRAYLRARLNLSP